MKFSSTLIRRGNGSVGNMTVTKWKDKLVMKQKAEVVANPQTDNQMRQRAKFALLVAVSTAIAGMIRRGFNEVATVMTEFNKFVSVNSGNGYLSWNGSAWEAQPELLEISKGSLETTNIALSGVANAATSLTVSYPSTAVGNQSVGDKMYCIISAGSKAGQVVGTVSRADGTVSVPLSSALATGDVINVYSFFVSADGNKASNTVYLTATV